jgi:predicted P-loop ATPase
MSAKTPQNGSSSFNSDSSIISTTKPNTPNMAEKKPSSGVPVTIFDGPLDLEGSRKRISLSELINYPVFTPSHFVRTGSSYSFIVSGLVVIEANGINLEKISKLGIECAVIYSPSGPCILFHSTKITTIQEYVLIHDYIYNLLSGETNHVSASVANPFRSIIHSPAAAVFIPGNVRNFTIEVAHIYPQEVVDNQLAEKRAGWIYSEGKIPDNVSSELLENYTKDGILEMSRKGLFDEYSEWVRLGAAIKGASFPIDFFIECSWPDIPVATFESMWRSFRVPRAGIGTLVWYVKGYDASYYRRRFLEYLANKDSRPTRPKDKTPTVKSFAQESTIDNKSSYAYSVDNRTGKNSSQKELEHTKAPDMSTRVPDHLWTPGHVEIKTSGQGANKKIQILPLLTIDNIRVIIDYYGFNVRENLMTKRIELESPQGVSTGKNDNNVMAMLMSLLTFNRMPIREAFSGYVLSVAHERMYHPVKDWLDSIDKEKECSGAIRKVFSTMHLGKIPVELAYTYFERWLISAVAAILEPSFRNRGVLTLQGGESTGKTTFFRSLMPSKLRSTFGEGISIDPRSKDSLELAITHWVCELGELDATFKRSDIAMLKAFLTKGLDEIRFPYERRSETYPRQTIFCATVNQARFLADQGQNTRFWVIPIIKLDQFQDVGIGDEQIEAMWLEAYNLYKQGRQWWLEREEERRLIDINKRHLEVDDVVSALETRYDWKCFDIESVTRVLTPTEICRELNILENRFALTKICEYFQHRGIPSVSLGTVEAFSVPPKRQETEEQSARIAAIREAIEAKKLDERRTRGLVPEEEIPPF